jgi:N-acyl-D-aspartate/D-glutamate deacylase
MATANGQATDYDLIIRGGRIIDGSGNEPYCGDVAIRDGRIVAVCDGRVGAAGRIDGSARRTINADGKIVTPGFVDIHTHYDGQATWENRLTPSCDHGVTTVVTGNCGVGFAPVRPADHDKLIKVMEGVEDIPEIVMAEGISWNWETFPEYLDALGKRQFDVDVGTQIAHSPIRVYVMGERGVHHAASTPEERERMSEIVTEAIRAGALGVSTSRSSGHRLKNGELAPSVSTEADELLALARGLRTADAGVFQMISEIVAPTKDEAAIMRSIASEAGRPLSFTLLQASGYGESWRELLSAVEAANADGLQMRGQVFVRPIGVMMGLDLSLHPFMTRPSYRAIAHLPLAERVRIMRDPEFKEKILAEDAVPDPQPMNNMLIAQTANLFRMQDPVDYAPPPEARLDVRAEAAGVKLENFAYDVLLEEDGRAILYLPGANYVGGNLDAVREMMAHPDTVFGLGDGGAHYGFICDASWPTFALTHWVREVNADQRFALPWIVSELTRKPAEAVGLLDRGLIAEGMKADVNIIDLDRLTLYAPHTVYDLPAGGRRMKQKAGGYVATIVSGVVTYENGEATGALPGRLVRGAREMAH